MASVFSVKLEPGSFAGGEKHAQRLELEQRFEKTSEGTNLDHVVGSWAMSGSKDRSGHHTCVATLTYMAP